MAANATTYIQGKPVDPSLEGHAHHVMPVRTYLNVFLALMVLTILTVGVSYADLGVASLWVAMAVALVKAGFVVGYFMHLKFDDRFHSFVFFSTILFVGIFFALTFLDINSRGAINSEWDVKGWMEENGPTIEHKPHGAEGAAAHGAAEGTEAAPPSPAAGQ